jgi:inosose dehydratase
MVMKNNDLFSRREFVKTSGMGSLAILAAPSLALLEAAKRFEIGSTFILWGYGADDLEPALRDMSMLGYHSFETFGWVLQEWEDERGGIEELLAKYEVPIVSAFCLNDVLDPSKRKEEIKKVKRWATLLKQYGGKLVEWCPSPVNTTWRKETNYDYREHKRNIIDSMNDYAKAVTDLGLVCSLHPHTGTPIETEEEVYFAMENVDTRYMKFGPDVGQLQKAKADPVKIVRDFMPLIEHVHLKDFIGGDNGYHGYAPLGEGIVKLRKILKMLEARKDEMTGMIMAELDSNGNIETPRTPYQAAKTSREFLSNMGYTFNPSDTRH